MTADADLLIAVTEMTKASEELRDDVRVARLYGQRSRKMIKLVGASLALGVIALVGLFYAIAEVRSTATTARKALVSTRTVCDTANERNLVQHRLWKGILDGPPVGDETIEQRDERTARITALVDTAFVPIDCEHVR